MHLFTTAHLATSKTDVGQTYLRTKHKHFYVLKDNNYPRDQSMLKVEQTLAGTATEHLPTPCQTTKDKIIKIQTITSIKQ